VGSESVGVPDGSVIGLRMIYREADDYSVSWIRVLGLAAIAASVAVGLIAALRPMGGGESVRGCGEVLGRGEREGVGLLLSDYTVRRGVKSINYTVSNQRSGIIYVGEPYDLQRLVNGEWETVKWIKDRVWVMVIHELGWGDSVTREIELPADIEPGCYRVVKRVTLESGESLEISAVFIIST